jgi:hypothetical protein
MKKVVSFLVLSGLILTSSALAQGTPEQRRACEDDANRWCPYDIPNARKVEACLRKNLKSITPDCQAEFGYKPKHKGK